MRNRAPLFALMMAAACGGTANKPSTQTASAPPAAARACGPAHATGVLAPVDAPRASSTVALAKQANKTLALVADEDDSSLRTIDVDAQKEIARTPLDGKPSHVIVMPDGRVLVALRELSRVAVLEAGASPDAPLAASCSFDVAAEPVSMALTPDDATLLVSSGWGRALGAYDAQKFSRSYEVPLAREPRAVVVADDGARAYVAQAVGGVVSVVDLRGPVHAVRTERLHGEGREALEKQQLSAPDVKDVATIKKLRKRFTEQEAMSPASCQGFALAKTAGQGAGRILAPQVLVEPGDPSTRPAGYGDDGSEGTEVPDVAVIDPGSGEAFAASIMKPDVGTLRMMSGDGNAHHHEECLLPRASAFDAKSGSLLVACLGIDAVIAYDGFAVSPARAEKRRWTVAAGPNGIAIDATKRRAFVWSQFDRTLDTIQLGAPELPEDASKEAPVAKLALKATQGKELPVAVALGRLLFHAVGDSRVSRDGRACASCHPDGRDDALVWATPEGPRRSIMLAGRVASTAPYSWSGSEKTLEEHLDITFDRLHGAGGLKSLELGALAAYVNALPVPVPRTRGDETLVAKGAAIFASKEVGCAECHTGTEKTDNKHHNVESKTDLDKSALFNTPSLHLVGGTGPYFHDGRYKTLRDLLTATDARMGHSDKLSSGDLDALEAYVRSL